MSQVPNPYEAPRTAQAAPRAVVGSTSGGSLLERWCGDVHRGAMLVLVGEAASALAWRGASGFAMAYRSESPSFFGSHVFNIFIKVLGAAGVLLGTRILTRPARSGVRMEHAAWANAAAAMAAFTLVARLGLALVNAEMLVAWLEPITIVASGIALMSSAWCVGSFFAAAGLVERPLSGRVLGVSYLAASMASVYTSCVAIPGFPHHLAAGSNFRSVLSLVFVGLAVPAFLLIRRLRDTRP
jgi:hypothetical protein